MTEKERDEERTIAEAGGLVDETGICLAIYGPDLEPDEVTAKMGCEPTSAHRRGDRRPDSNPYDAGAWLLKERGEAPNGPEQLIRRLMMKLPVEHAVWAELSSRFDVQLRIAIHFTGWDRGFDLTSETVTAMGRLHATVGFDLYGYDEQDA